MSSKALGIRETVKVLLALLTDSGCAHVPSESFRQAKFNKTEAVGPFWMILQHIVLVNEFLKSGDLRDIREVLTSPSHCSSVERKKAVLQVQKYALDLGYFRLEFYDNTVGSCEQLLFFAWLLQATSLSSHLQSYHMNATLHCSSIPLASSKHFLLDRVEKDTISFDREVQTLCRGLAPLDDVLRNTQWVKGMLHGNCRSVENAHKAHVKLSHSVLQSCSHSVSQKHQRHPVSLHDLFLLRYPEQLSVCVKRLEWHIASLNTLLKWQQHEPVFWQWMESVLDQHTALPHTDSSHKEEQDENSDAAEVTKTELCSGTLRNEVVQCQQKLIGTIAAKQPHIERLYKAKSMSKEPTVPSKNTPNDCEVAHHHLSQQQVAIETSVSCPVLASQSCSGPLCDSLQYRTVEHEISILQASIEKMEGELHLLQSAIVL